MSGKVPLSEAFENEYICIVNPAHLKMIKQKESREEEAKAISWGYFNDINFMKVWNSEKNKEIRKFIKDTNCNCSYECALTYNILGNWRYQPSLLKAVFTNY